VKLQRKPSRLCRPCKTGIGPDQPKTFDPNCPRCREKLALGLRTGNEKHPRTLGLQNRRRLREEVFAAVVERTKAANRASASSGAASPPARSAA
jgi:hypothetical protein